LSTQSISACGNIFRPDKDGFNFSFIFLKVIYTKLDQSKINIGMVGHVDHGKTSLAEALSGIWTDQHSEEIKRGISIRLGYADCEFYKCQKCNGSDAYSTRNTCPNCGSKTKFLRKISLVDSPGHGTLMATMLSGAAIMDGAILVIAANEPCPQPQTAEHLEALNIRGVKKIVVAQNKIDLVSKKEAIENYEQIKKFTHNSVAKDAPIIPIAAHYGANIDVLIETIEGVISTPKRDNNGHYPLMYIARSFDINRPGMEIKNIKGGVIGGSIIEGEFKIGDEIEIRPGVKREKRYEPLHTRIVSLNAGGGKLDKVKTGGLIAMGTTLDPSLTKSDGVIGNVVGLKDEIPDVYSKLNLEIHLLNRLVGSEEELEIKPLIPGEQLMLSVGTAVTSGKIKDVKKGGIELTLPVCARKEQRVAISRKIGMRWRLIGYGVVKG